MSDVIDPARIIAGTTWDTPVGVLQAVSIIEDAIFLVDKDKFLFMDEWPAFAFQNKRLIKDSAKWGSGWEFRCMIAKIKQNIELPEGAEIGWNNGKETLIVMSKCYYGDYKFLKKKLKDVRSGVVMMRIEPKVMEENKIYWPDRTEIEELNKDIGTSWNGAHYVGETMKLVSVAWHLTRGETVVVFETQDKEQCWFLWSSLQGGWLTKCE